MDNVGSGKKRNPFLNTDKNPLLRVFLKHTFYAQFCVRENPAEVKQTIDNLKTIGFTGLFWGYAKEVVLADSQTKNLASCGEGETLEECMRNETTPWAQGTMETVRLAQRGDFVALKFTVAGRQALHTLSECLRPPAALADAIDSVCSLAAKRSVRLLIDHMRKYNTATPGKAVIYSTYQACIKSTPQTLQRHLEMARDDGFTLGVKLVRGAYIGSEPRHLTHDTKADTDAAYAGIAESLLRRRWGDALRGDSHMPPVSLVLASHNADSVRKARAVCDAGEAKIEIAYAQFQGMANEVSCERVSTMQSGVDDEAKTRAVEAYKYLVQGSAGECIKYLLRRAHENRDAVRRTRSGRDAMWSELVRRVTGLAGILL